MASHTSVVILPGIHKQGEESSLYHVPIQAERPFTLQDILGTLLSL